VILPRANGKTLADDYMERFTGLGAEIEGGLVNDRQRQRFREKLAQSALQFRAGLQRHETAQINEYAKTVTNATVTLETEAALKSWDDPKVVAASITNITEALQAQGLREGVPADALKVLIADRVSKLQTGVIIMAADAGNLDYARERFEQVKDQLDADDRLRVKKVVDEGDFEVRTQTGAEQMWKRAGGDVVKALELAREKFKGKEEDAVVQRIKALDSERVTLRERAQKDAADEGWRLVASGKPIPPSLYARMDGRDVAALRRAIVDGPPQKTNVAKWLEFTNMSADQMVAMSPGDLLRDYRQHFSDADLRNANEMMRAAKGLKGGKKSDEGLQLMTVADLTKRAARELGILPEKGQAKPEHEAAFDDFRNVLQGRINAWEASNGKKASPEVLQEIIREEKLNKVKVDEWGRDPEKPVISLTEKELAKAYVNVGNREVRLASIPADYRQDAIRRIQARGLAVTESLIAQMWVADQTK